ncbi:SDR family oxidoreductase [Yinghuangia soli]|uniref:SDR family oxidoreductase n=1 Tax=Yinghuangia soli TaxID=2908204 RepID=A0AA41Q4S7_9ACTN|nr:SDR family oxidoreductase [Yinghuangia soli]MCF2531543.1 SDR family oxidoreductase [Yinghuangia soli]
MTAGQDGRVVVVTGGTRGIGLGLVQALLDRGCRVALCGRSEASVAAAVAALDAAADRVLGRSADVADRRQVQELWDATAAAYGRVDVWINNAGATTSRKPLWQLPADQVDTVVAANLLGVAHGSAVALAGFTAQGSGDLWNMEGFGSDGRTLPGLATYGSTKRAVTYLTTALAKEAAAHSTGVRVAHLSPGMVVTDLLTHDYSDAELAQAAKVFRILADRVETVAPWLADRVLEGARNGGRVAWLTRRKAMGRFLAAPIRRRDPFAPSEAAA